MAKKSTASTAARLAEIDARLARIEAIREALTYAEENAALLDLEAAYERFRLEEWRKDRGPLSVP